MASTKKAKIGLVFWRVIAVLTGRNCTQYIMGREVPVESSMRAAIRRKAGEELGTGQS